MITRIPATKLDKEYLTIKRYAVQPALVSFENIVVNKPWGYEYLLYTNGNTEVWSLLIEHNKSTSMHCHPRKKTALIVLEGRASFSLLNQSLELSPLDAVVIDTGVFHSTEALSRDGIKILELETPPMKHDLVRLEDKYGRTNKGYEGLEEMTCDINGKIRFAANEINTAKKFCNKKMCIYQPEGYNELKKLATGKKKVLMAVLGGSIKSTNGQELFGIGDLFYLEDLTESNRGCHFNDVQLLSIKQ